MIHDLIEDIHYHIKKNNGTRNRFSYRNQTYPKGNRTRL